MLEKSKKKIAKNTVALYFRMILTMGVSLYTSRVVLNALGEIDYGVYNVVGGVVAMLGFFNSSIGTSTQRFLNVGMADTEGDNLRNIFSTAVNVHLIIGLFTVFLLETVGLWFVLNKLVIPETQMNAALWVYQCSILSFLITITSAPYSAALIAYEKMSAFAVMSIVDVSMKLGIAFIIKDSYNGSRLKLYALLILATTIVMQILYIMYCSVNFKKLRYRFVWELHQIRKMVSFSGWMIFGCLSDLLSTQGVNMLINVFFGPVFNAARAIAVQIQSAVGNFSNSFIVSVNPQIVKSYASDDLKYAYQLVFTASKMSFYLMLLMVIPIIIKSSAILSFWLGNVPEYTSVFANLIMLEYLLRSSYTPIAQINQASGNIRLYQLCICILYVVNFIISYILFSNGFPVYSTFVVSSCIALIGLLVRLWVLRFQLKFPSVNYFKDVTLRVFAVGIISFAINYLITMSFSDNLFGIIATVFMSIIVTTIIFYFLGFNSMERNFVNDKFSFALSKLSTHRK